MPITANWLTLSTTPIKLVCNGHIIGNATGFFLKPKQTWYLVTNWHVLSGRDPRTGQCRSPTGAVPDTCLYLVPSMHDQSIRWSQQAFSLGDALLKSARWVQHPDYGQSVDVAAFPLGDTLPSQVRNILEKPGYDEGMWVDIGGEVFLPGYPLGMSAGGGFPIWKRASLASSTEFGEGINKCILVDTATREGMSGSPCIAVSTRYYFRKAADSMKMTRVDDPFAWRLMGVYSGRINPSDRFEAQLGTVWRENLIFDVLERGVQATVEISG